MNNYADMEAWEVNAEACRIIGMDYVPPDVLIELLEQYAPNEEDAA
jgi:hypothetical protein